MIYEGDAERKASNQYNRETLADTGEETIELYGVWAGNFDFATPPRVREEVSLKMLVQRNFRFKEQGFYVVHLENE
jgi:hypothetical protein